MEFPSLFPHPAACLNPASMSKCSFVFAYLAVFVVAYLAVFVVAFVPALVLAPEIFGKIDETTQKTDKTRRTGRIKYPSTDLQI